MHGTLDALPASRPSRWALALRLAWRDLRGGFHGFGVFLACIALGVAAIGGVASLSRSLSEGLVRQGRVILGGDMAFALVQREASAAERAFLADRGQVFSIATLRAMAVAGDKGAALVEAKAVDAAYPPAGGLVTEPPGKTADLLSERNGTFGAIADPVLLARLELAVGDRITVGAATLELRAGLVSEPDKIATGIGFGPRLLLSQEALAATGLVQPGSLVRWTYRLTLPSDMATDADLERVTREAARALPEAGWDIRSRTNADPRFAANIERFTQFLTLVGLTALLVGGVGVANAVAAFIERKRGSIAILKSLGASGQLVLTLYLVEVMLMASIGIAAGLVVAAILPFAVVGAIGASIPVPVEPVIAWRELGLAILYGVLTALAFALTPLGRASDIVVSGLLRDQIDPARRGSPSRVRLVVTGLVAALAILAVATAYDRRLAVIFIAASAFSFLLLRGLALALMELAKRLPRPRHAVLVLSLGLGITLLVTLAVIDANLTRQLTGTLPAQAPSFFFLDIPNADADAFARFLAEQARGARLDRVPMMRGRLVSLKGVPVAEIKAEEQVAWVLEGDRGITYAAVPPEGSVLTSGEWWAADYTGPPLVSFEAEIAAGLGLALGDSVTVNVLGRNVTARIANLRKVEWRSLGINFVMVFSPNSFAGAPHTHLATVTYPGGADAATESRLLREVAKAFPSVTSVRVKDALEAINALVAQLVTAIRAASAVVIAASLLVLAGALASGHRARLYDAVVLKTLGARRWQLIGAYVIEYGLLGLATAAFGLLAGFVAGFFVVTRVMRIAFSFDLGGPLLSASLAVLVAVVLGLAGTWRILGQKPAPYLRDL
jgi:putative ABC transport system permease protein